MQQAILDADGTIAPTEGECKEGMDISYDGQWGYHPLLISLANTREPLYLVNRPGNRPSHEPADDYLDKSVVLCRRAGFAHILLRGDTAFTQTWKLDQWDQAGDVTFIFGANATSSLVARVQALPETAWRRLERPVRYEVQTQERAKPENVKARIVRERGYKNFRLEWEEVAELAYQPGRCRQPFRMVALRKMNHHVEPTHEIEHAAVPEPGLAENIRKQNLGKIFPGQVGGLACLRARSLSR